MRRRLLTYAFALLLVLNGSTFAQQQVLITGAHVDELGELPPDMRLGVFVADRGLVADDEVASVRMVAGTFDLVVRGVAPDERQLRPLLSGSFPLAFMIGNEFVTDRDGVRFATAVLHPYQDRCGSGAFDPLYDARYGTTIPELPDFGGFFNLVYVSGPIVLRATAAEFVLQRGWNLIVSRFASGRLVYEVGTELDIVVVTTGVGPGTRELLPCP
ncbi:MAG: hypothetical protein O3A02_04665 [bacterium]|nr:hypothetical protein [bacterium]